MTPEENDYLRLRDKLDLGAKARRYLKRRRDLNGGLSVEDDWPRGPYLLLRLTRDRAAHEYNLRKLVRYPDNFRTIQVQFSERQLRQVQNRIDADWKALARRGFEITSTGADIDTSTVEVELITKRTDAVEYFRARYGPVTVKVIATEPTFLDCEEAGTYEVARDGRGLTIHWARSGSVENERVDVVEHPDRVEIGVVDRFPHGAITLDSQPDKRRVRLAQPLGDRPVIDTANGRRLLQIGPSPGEPPCPTAKPLTRLQDFINTRKDEGLPHGRAFVRRMLKRKDPYTRAEHEYLKIRETLEIAIRVYRYESRHADEFAGSAIEDHFPGRPVLVEYFTGHLRRHARNIRRLMKYPDQLRVVRATWTARELEALDTRIRADVAAGDGFVGGHGDAGVFVWHSSTDADRLVLKVITPWRDAARYFRERYGPAVKVMVIGRRYECRERF